MRPTEGIAADARRTRSANVEIRRTLKRAVGWITVAVADDAREIEIRCDEGVVGGVAGWLLQKGGRSCGIDIGGTRDGYGADLPCDWRPRKTRVSAYDGVGLPTAYDLAYPIHARAIDGEIPESAGGKGVLGVEVGGPMLVLRTGGIRLVGLSAGTFVGKLVNALAVAIVEVKEEAAIKLPAQTRVQGVVIRIDVAGREIDSKESRTRRLQEILINKTCELETATALVRDVAD